MPTCPYCEGEVSLTAKKCRHCGEWLKGEEAGPEEAPPPPGCLLGKEILPPGYLTMVVWPKIKTPWAPFLMLSLVILMFLASAIDSNMGEQVPAEPEEPFGMRTECQQRIKTQLSDPRSARFSGIFDSATRATQPEANHWLLFGWVEAEIAFGGTVRNRYICDVDLVGGSWTIVDLIIEP